MKTTQKELVARYLVSNMSNWIASYTLIEKVAVGHITNDADTRAHQLVREGYVSPNATYTFESRRKGKFTEFRCKERIPTWSRYGEAPTIHEIQTAASLVDEVLSLESLQAGNLRWFEELP